ncbi:MAG TPA: zinc-dependent metalloprotease [Bacteroidota bacterium]|nr:zinc-dependent metalloprotease [Bacteroidota bacterium]
MHAHRIVALAAGLMLGAAGLHAQDAKPPQPPKEGIKPFGEVITKDAKADSGLFNIYRVKQKWYMEIPKKEIGKDFLMVTSQAKTQTGIGYGGDEVNDQVVRWERVDDRLLFRSVMFFDVAADSLPVSTAVKKATNPPILMSFEVQAYNKDSSAVVIDVSGLFTADMTELGLSRFEREQYKIRRLDPARSFVERMKPFPDNVEVTVTLTYDAGQVPMDASLSTITIQMHHSMVRLPEQPMAPRLYDERVSYFGIFQYDYGYPSQRAEPRRYIARWRLEPKDSAAYARGELVEPKKPITFYIDRGTPDKWRPWLKKGVEDWQSAFEKAGFKHAIVAKDAPSEKEDPNWSSEDVRYSTIRWLPSNIENAYGPHISDPRTGEILDSDIGFFHNVMNLARNWYFVQAGAVDPACDRLPLPDELMGRMLEYIAAHEVGHTLGFPHNMKASSQFPVDSLRSPSFTAKYGTEASIMDYGRFNYVAQPGDGATLIPKIGPYDLFAAEWGYRLFPGTKSPDEEKPFLNAIAARQEAEPYLRFGDADGIDPTAQTEDLGADPVQATQYGLKNIVRIADKLLTATTKAGEDYSTLRELYEELVAQRTREFGHVANEVGGVVMTRRVTGEAGVVHTPVPRDRQKAALAFLLKEGFRTPTELLKPGLVALFEPTGTEERVLASQRSTLTILLNNARLERLVNSAALAAPDAKPYTLAEMSGELRAGIWSELGAGSVKPDIYRRNLQRAYIELMGTKLNPPPWSPPPGLPPGFRLMPPPPLPGEARAIIRAELMRLDEEIARAVPKAANPETRAHLLDSRYQISKILYPEKKS